MKSPLPRPRMFIQRTTMRNMVISVERELETMEYAMLWLVAYTFLLRVPSEALPITRGDVNTLMVGQAVIYLENEKTLALRLKCRKNKPRGGILRRTCICTADSRTCPVHTLWHKFLEPIMHPCASVCIRMHSYALICIRHASVYTHVRPSDS